MLSQLLKLNGAMKLTIAAPAGPKLDLARKLEAGDEYVELSRTGPEAQWQYLKEANPHGFDAVVSTSLVTSCRNRMPFPWTRLKLLATKPSSMNQSTMYDEEESCSSMVFMTTALWYIGRQARSFGMR